MAFQLFNFDDIHVRSVTVDGLVYFAAKEVGQALEYSDIPWAIKTRRRRVYDDFWRTATERAHSLYQWTRCGPGSDRIAPTRVGGRQSLEREVAQRTWFVLTRSVFQETFRQEVQEICFRRGFASPAAKGCVRHQKQPDATFERNRFA